MNIANAYRQRIQTLFLLSLIIMIFGSCSNHIAGQELDSPAQDTTHVQWKGDNMSDFKAEGLTVSSVGSGLLPRVPYAERKVGLAYTTWARRGFWDAENVWALPTLGKYLSDDRAVIRKHAEWIADAGVDFIWVDWSNDVDYHATLDHVLNDASPSAFSMIERATYFIFEEYSKMRTEGKKTPNISIFIGNPAPEQVTAVSDGRLKRKADQIDQWFVHNTAHPEFKDLLQQHNGKPLLVCYSGTPTHWQTETPPWNDDRFTVRFMTGYVTEQPTLFDATTRESKYKYWSWEERRAQTYTVDNG